MPTRPKFHQVIKEKQNPDGTMSYSLRYNSDLFKQGACAGLDTELFYPVEEKDTPEYIVRRLCSKCPIKEACLEWGLAHEKFGTWGGVTAWARVSMRRLRGWTLTDISLPSTQR